MVASASASLSLAEQIAPLALAPSSKLPPPRKGTVYRALMAGGREHTARELRKELLDTWGIDIREHWHADRSRLPYVLPDDCEMVLMVTTVMPHTLSDRVRACASKAKVPVLPMSTKRTSWIENFSRFGLQPKTSNVVQLKAVPVEESKAETPTVTNPTPVQMWGAMLADERKRAGMSRKELAGKLGISDASILHFEHGIRAIKFIYYKGMLEALPALRSLPPPPNLEGKVFDLLAPSPQIIAEAAPEITIVEEKLIPRSRAEEIGALYGAALQRTEDLQRQIDDLMRQHEESRATQHRLHAELIALVTGKELMAP